MLVINESSPNWTPHYVLSTLKVIIGTGVDEWSFEKKKKNEIISVKLNGNATFIKILILIAIIAIIYHLMIFTLNVNV